LLLQHPAAANWGAVERLEANGDPEAREIGREWRAVLEERGELGLGSDLGIF
jgi:hypothetical protein